MAAAKKLTLKQVETKILQIDAKLATHQEAIEKLKAEKKKWQAEKRKLSSTTAKKTTTKKTTASKAKKALENVVEDVMENVDIAEVLTALTKSKKQEEKSGLESLLGNVDLGDALGSLLGKK